MVCLRTPAPSLLSPLKRRASHLPRVILNGHHAAAAQAVGSADGELSLPPLLQRAT